MAFLAALLAGCGGNATSYDSDAFTTCIEEHGVNTFAMSSAIYDDDVSADVAGVLRVVDHAAALPGGTLALTDAGEFLVVYVGSSTDRASEAESRLRDALRGGKFELRRRSNLLTLTADHPTRGFIGDVDACAESAQRT